MGDFLFLYFFTFVNVNSVHHTQKRSRRTAYIFFLNDIFPFPSFPYPFSLRRFFRSMSLTLFEPFCVFYAFVIFILCVFIPLVSKESYSSIRVCFCLNVSVMFYFSRLSVRREIYMFWMSCRVASISSWSNLFFSLSAARSSGKITG